MYKSVKHMVSQKNMDNYGDGIYEMKGKSKAWAKRNMHKLTRIKLKRVLNKEIRGGINNEI